MYRLIFFKGKTRAFESRILPGRMVIGRSDNCDIALPDKEISRTHCYLERPREDGPDGAIVEMIDRSRHGTLVNGERVERAFLKEGDRVQLSADVSFEVGSQQEYSGTTPVARDASHEQILGGDEAGLDVVRLSLRVVAGPAQGVEIPLPGPDCTVSGRRGAIQVDDPDLLDAHFRLLVNRGRSMVMPLAGAVTVDRERIRGLYPLLPVETFCAGSSSFQVVPTRGEEVHEQAQFGEMLGESSAIRRVFGMLHRMASFPETVLLLGESGTGKELAARGLHDTSTRRMGPFVPVNCGAITESLFESELFGHEKGSFTGAAGRRDGAFHHANTGTLFLDEVGEIPAGAQAKLLRALESGEVRRVGADSPTYPDVRVVAATNRNLLDEVNRGAFREDLYFRLAVLTVRIPPLRSRREDIPALCSALSRNLHPKAQVSAQALEILKGYSWPGNVRELRNVLTRAVVLHGPIIDAASITFESAQPSMVRDDPYRASMVEEAERALCQAALARHRGNRTAAARELGLPRTTFLYKLQRLGME